jgi:hypothetical protein
MFHYERKENKGGTRRTPPIVINPKTQKMDFLLALLSHFSDAKVRPFLKPHNNQKW